MTLPAVVQASVPEASTPTIKTTSSNTPPKKAKTSAVVAKTKAPTAVALKGKAKKVKQKRRLIPVR